jgi:hypothetical protein
MSKQAQLADGTILDFPDDTPDEVMDRVVKKHLSEQGTIGPRSEFNQQSIPYQSIMGAAPPELLERVKGLGQSVGQTGLTGINWLASMAGVKPIPMPNVLTAANPNQAIGQQVGQLAQFAALPTGGATLPVRALQTGIGALGGAMITPEEPYVGAVTGGLGPLIGQAIEDFPRRSRAVGKFEALKKASEFERPDLTEPRKAIEFYKEQKATGGSSSTPLNAFIKRERVTDILGNPVPIYYPEAFNFASNAGRIADLERQATSPSVKAALSRFSQAMDAANRAAAERALPGTGGQTFDEAMREYAQNARLRGLAAAAKKWAPRAILGSGLGYGAYRNIFQ